jgi:hypothetical protein
MAKTIEIVLNTDPTSPDCGKLSAEAFGYNGKGCDVDLAVFLKLGEVKKQGKKPEYKNVQKKGVQVRA